MTAPIRISPDATCCAAPRAALAIWRWPGSPVRRVRISRPDRRGCAPRAKRVIFLCMSGGPAQLDTFDYKPQVGKKPHPGSIVDFKQRGQSGVWVSDLLPNIARHADKLCVLNAMHADTGNHAQSFLQLHTGDRLRPCPSMGVVGRVRSGHGEPKPAGLHQPEHVETFRLFQRVPAAGLRRHADRRERRGHVDRRRSATSERSSADAGRSAANSISSRR